MLSNKGSGPQDSSPLSQFCLKNPFLGQKLKIHVDIFFLYKFWKSFVYFVEKEGLGGSTSSALRYLNFFLVVLLPKRNGISLGANSYQIFLHLGPPYYYVVLKSHQKCLILYFKYYFKTKIFNHIPILLHLMS